MGILKRRTRKQEENGMQQEQIKKSGITFGLVAANIFVYLVFLALTRLSSKEYIDYIYMGGQCPDKVQQGEYWRLLTSVFMHMDFEHIFNNMFLLICAGPILEQAMGHIRYLVLYLLAGIGSSLFSVYHMISAGEGGVSVGASGAIFGVIAALLWVVIYHKGHYATLSGKGLVFLLAITFYSGLKSPGTDNWGHAGGLITGFLLAVLLYRKKRKPVDFDTENLYTRE